MAENHSLVPELQSVLAGDEVIAVRCALAQNSHLSLDTQRQLFHANDSARHDIISDLAKNPTLYPEIQMAIVKDKSISTLFVGLNLAANPKLTLKAAIFLYFHNYIAVRNRLKNNNPVRYKQIQKFIKDLLQKTGVGFISLVDDDRQNDFYKGLLLKHIGEPGSAID